MCILAVDFTIFPRKYAKTYLSGFSLVHPFLSPHADGHRRRPHYGHRRPRLRHETPVFSCIPSPAAHCVASPSANSACSFSVSLVSSSCAVGVTRRNDAGSDYVVNELEYGKHWNFFFSLAVAQAGGYVVSFFASARVSAVVGCVIAAYYQLLLSMGLGEWDSSHRLTQEHSRRMGQRLALSQRRGTVLLVW